MRLGPRTFLAQVWVAVAATLIAATAPGAADDFTKLVVFGDSLADSGNFFTATASQLPTAPYFEGRFSDGPVFVEALARMLDLEPPRASQQGGTNYSWAGAFAGSDRDLGAFLIPSVRSQVGQFLEAVGRDLDADALYIINAGGNDVINAVRSNLESSRAQVEMRVAAGHHATAVAAMVDAGAVHILVVVAPDIGLTPGYWRSQSGSELASAYNETLIASLDSLDIPTIRRFDLSSVIEGGENLPRIMDEPCFVPPDLCADSSDFFFFDDIHPTGVGHELLAARMLQLIREPTALLAVSWSRVKAAVSER